MPILPLNEPVVIVNVISGRLLDADTGTINADGTKVQLYGRGATNQLQRQWRLVSAGGTKYYIVCERSKRFLDADTQTIGQDGTKMQLYGTAIPAPANRQWDIEDVSNGRVYIRNAQSGRLLDADTGSLNRDATTVQLYGTDWSPLNRQWYIMRLSDFEAAPPLPHTFQDAPKSFDLFIVSPLSFAGEFAEFQTAKGNHAIVSHVATLTGNAKGHGGIVNDFTGADDAERVKRAIEYAFRVYHAKYVMLAGDASVLPARYRYTQEGPTGKWWGWHDGTYNPSDLYYANLYNHSGPHPILDTWDANANNKYNEQEWVPEAALSYNPDNVDGYPDIAVGRIPAHTAVELRTYLKKVIAYENKSVVSPGAKTFGFAADNGYPTGDQMCDDIAASIPSGYASSIKRELFNAKQGDTLLPGWEIASSGALLNLLNTCWFVGYVGHGSSGGWDFSSADFGSVQTLNNSSNFPIVFAAACSTGEFLPNPPFGQYEDQLGFRWFYYYTDSAPAQQIAEQDQNGNVIRYVVKPLQVPTPSVYDLPSATNRTVASAWLFNGSGGGIAYIGEVVVAEDNFGRDFAKEFVAALGGMLPVHTLGDIWLKAQQQYWNDNKTVTDVLGSPRIYLGIMTLFADPSLRLPPL